MEGVLPPRGVKISVDYGLARILNCEDDPRQDGYLLTREQLESLLPGQHVDRPASARLALPSWPESQSAGIMRLVGAIDRISEEVRSGEDRGLEAEVGEVGTGACGGGEMARSGGGRGGSEDVADKVLGSKGFIVLISGLWWGY